MFKYVMLLLLAVSVFSMTAFAEALVVISSDDPHLSPGDIVDSKVKFKVPAGKTVRLMRKAGTMVLVKGPFDHFPLQKMSKDKNKELLALARLTQKGNDDISTIGTMRSGAPGSSPTDYRWINTDTGDDQCVFPKTQLWRYDNSKKVTLTIQKKNGKKITLSWKKGKNLIVWPQKLLRENGKYTINKKGAANGAQYLKLHVAPKKVITSEYSRLVWMSGKKCSEQAAIYAQSIDARLQ